MMKKTALLYHAISYVLVMFLHITVQSQTISQPETDSLKQLIAIIPNDSIRGRALNKLAFHYIFNNIEEARPLLKRGLMEARRNGLVFGESELLNTKAIYFDILGEKDSALLYFNRSLEISQKHRFDNIKVMTLNGMGLMYWKSGRFNEALASFFEALEMNEKHFPEQKESRTNYLSNIGLIYQELAQYHKAIDYHLQALKLREELNLINGQAISYANLGVCKQKLELFTEAESFYNRAIEKAETAQNWRMYYSLHNNLGNTYNTTGRYQQAIAAYKKSINRPANLGANPKSDLSIYINLSSLHNTIQQPRASMEYAKKGLELLQQYPHLRNFADELFYVHAESHYMLGNISEGSRNMREYRNILDSIFSGENAMALAEMEKRFETAQKDKSILEQNQLLQQKDIQMKTYTLWSVVLLLLILLTSGVLFALYKRKEALAQRATLELKLAEQKELTRIQDERLRISRELHDNIGSYLTLLSASLEQIKEEDVNREANKIISLQDNLSMSLRELRKTVWLLNKQMFTIDEIAIRLRDFFKPLHQNGTQVNISSEGNAEQLLSEIQTTHLFRVIQEAVSNAYKYAQCSQIMVNLKVEGSEQVCIQVSDNGLGFDILKIEKGNGMRNMKSRMKELSGSLEIESKPGQGTIITGCFNI